MVQVGIVMMLLNRVAFGAAHQIRVTFDESVMPAVIATKPDAVVLASVDPATPPKPVTPKRQVLSHEGVTRFICDKLALTMPFYRQPKVTVEITYPGSASLMQDTVLPPSRDLTVRVLTDTPPEKMKEDRPVLERVIRTLFRDQRLGSHVLEQRVEAAMTQAQQQLPPITHSDLFTRVLVNASRPTDVVLSALEAGVSTTLIDP
jgi:hypothetical protein